MTTAIESQNAAFLAAREAAAKAAASTSSTTTSKTDAAATQAQLSSDVSFFLKMLTTQLKNQDPSSPLDTNQFTQQIAQYSGVQQQVNTNATLEKLLASYKQSSTTSAVSYIGKEVESKGSTGVVLGGQGAFTYILPSAAKSAEITIKDSTGRTVFTGSGTTASGRNTVVWDGVNSSTGKQEPDGTYTIAVAPLDSNGKAMTPEMRAVGIVSGVETDASGNVLLDIGDTKVNYTDVLTVRVATRADTTPTPSPTPTPTPTPTES